MEKNDHYSIKKFLNLDGHHSIASMGIYLDSNEYFIRGEVTINDCSKTVFLDMEVDSYESLENAIYKLDTIIEIAKKGKKQIKKVADKRLDDIIRKNRNDGTK